MMIISSSILFRINYFWRTRNGTLDTKNIFVICHVPQWKFVIARNFYRVFDFLNVLRKIRRPLWWNESVGGLETFLMQYKDSRQSCRWYRRDTTFSLFFIVFLLSVSHFSGCQSVVDCSVSFFSLGHCSSSRETLVIDFWRILIYTEWRVTKIVQLPIRDLLSLTKNKKNAFHASF